MEGPRNTSSRKRKTKEMSRGQVVLALPAPSVPLPPHLSTTATKMAGSREKPKEVVLAHSAPNAPPPPLHTTTKRAGTREKSIVVIDQCALNASPSLLHSTATKRAGTRKKAKEVALALSPPNAPPPPLKFMTARKVTATFDPDHHPQTPPVSAKREREEGAAAPTLQEPGKNKPRLKVVGARSSTCSLHTTATKRAGTRKKAKEIALALSPPIAPPPPLNITTAPKVTTAFDPDHHPQTLPVSARREQEEGAAAPALQEPEKKKPKLKVVGAPFLDPDATQSSSDDDYTPPVTNGRKRKEVEIVHEIKLTGKNPISKTRRKIIKDQKNEEELVGEKIVIKKEIGSSACGEKVKESSSTSSTAGKEKTTTKGKKKTETKKKTMTEVVDVLWEIPGEIPDLDLLKREKDRILYRFFDGVPEYCEDIPPEVKGSYGFRVRNQVKACSWLCYKDDHVFVFLAAEYGTPKNSLNQISLWDGISPTKENAKFWIHTSNKYRFIDQISLWDGILPTKEHAKFWIHTSNKYRFIDQGTNLRGKEFNLTLHWHVMPKTGKMFADKIVKPGYRLPQEYR